MPYRDKDLDQHWLREWLGAWRHQDITWTTGDFSLVRIYDIHITAISQRVPTILFCIMSSKIILMKVLPYLPAVNEQERRLKRSNYSRRPWDWYTAPIVKGAEHPPPPHPPPPPPHPPPPPPTPTPTPTPHTSYSAELSPTGPKVWEIILRSWQVELSTWVVKIRNQPIQKRSCFLIS